ncbi:histidine phosphatase family protein [Sediminibacillus dalangtanensis]|uniref:Histidine phosphatase family protein n=1 Tax=Sediminibacillus dalangtanensis TaxID=2729421 RepID=A0ABX7W1N0_9BACI|nr:histidine phosphatase family protein [Sediminibacillus dalangtanensis]QTN01277.1 histidine phosphatase family protein [Sediminibacillus dalangtanensis]
MICLVRHGETDWNLQGRLQGETNIPLNETGIQQAKECRDYFKDMHMDRIITTPLIRAQKTAEIINENWQKPIEIMEAFKERSFGEAEGMPMEERNKRYPHRNYPGQEPFDAFRERVMQGIEEISNKYMDEELLLVAHGGVINVILSTVSDGKIGTGKTKLINACISNIQLWKEGWKIHNYNQIDHLSKYTSK